MPTLLKRKKKERKREAAAAAAAAAGDTPPAPAEPAVAHIITPRSKLVAAKAGEEVKSICGAATIKGDAVPNSPVCRDCFMKQLKVDDDKVLSDQRTAAENARNTANRRYNEGVTAGERTGQEKAMAAIREAAERRAADSKDKQLQPQ